MKTAQLIELFRIYAHDNTEPYLWGNEEIAYWLREGEKECASRQRLIKDNSTPAVCNITVAPGRAVYPVHDAVISITNVGLYSADSVYIRDLVVMNRGSLDEVRPLWRTDSGEPRYIVHDDTELLLVPKPDTGYNLVLDVVRRPIGNPSREPEIADQHHKYMVHWALYEAYTVSENDKGAPAKAAKHLAFFGAKYGPVDTAGANRRSRENNPHRNRLAL